jgi:hypothetical protein
MNIDELKKSIDKDIEIISLRQHSKASENYIDINLYNNKTLIWSGSIPYIYRRTGLFIENEKELI